MGEVVLRLFFEGHATAEELARDVAGATHRQTPSDGPAVSHFHIQDIAVEFPVESRHLLHLLDAVEEGKPEVNDPLTPVVLEKVRHHLRTGGHTFTREDLRPEGRRPHLVSTTQKSPEPGV